MSRCTASAVQMDPEAPQQLLLLLAQPAPHMAATAAAAALSEPRGNPEKRGTVHAVECGPVKMGIAGMHSRPLARQPGQFTPVASLRSSRAAIWMWLQLHVQM
jgi:hypothetical protein